jgi:hypothetical protein
MAESKLNMDDVRIFLEMIYKDGFILWESTGPCIISVSKIKCIMFVGDKLYIHVNDHTLGSPFIYAQEHIEHSIRKYKKEYLKKIAIEDKTETLAEEIDKLYERIRRLEAKNDSL